MSGNTDLLSTGRLCMFEYNTIKHMAKMQSGPVDKTRVFPDVSSQGQ